MPRPAPVQRDTDSNPLLPDELAMVRMVAQGVPEMAMARRLGINETQVRDRLLVIFRKLAVAGLLDQLVYAGEKIWKPR